MALPHCAVYRSEVCDFLIVLPCFFAMEVKVIPGQKVAFLCDMMIDMPPQIKPVRNCGRKSSRQVCPLWKVYLIGFTDFTNQKSDITGVSKIVHNSRYTQSNFMR